MKKKLLCMLCTLVLTGAVLAGCGGDAAKDGGDGTAAVSEESNAGENTADASSDGSAEETDGEKAGADADEAEAEGAEAGDTEGSTELADGVYTAEFDTDSSMFHVNEANEGKGVLTVENGKMTIHVSLVSKNIVNLFAGTAEDAQKDGAEILQPTTDTVTYSDGISEEVYGFDIPVPAIDQEFNVALIGSKGKWYDHKVSVTDPQPQE